jgi:hypothetical protein
MIPKQAGFYGTPFTAHRGVRQGDIISPMIFNVVCDAVIRECESLGNGLMDALFYADDGMITSNNPTELQSMLENFTNSFQKMGLKMNVDKTKALIMTGKPVREKMSDTAYKRRMIGEGMSHRERQLEKIACPGCHKQVQRQYLSKHQQTKSCRKNQMNQPTPNTQETCVIIEPQTQPTQYSLHMPTNRITSCPALGNCPFKTASRWEMRRHFQQRHNRDFITILEEGPLPKCAKCGIQLRDVGPKHQASKACQQVEEKMEGRAKYETNKSAQEKIKFLVFGQEIETVEQFRYLGRIVTCNDDDRPAMRKNLQKAQGVWSRLARLLSRTGANTRVMARIYRAVVQSILLYGSESWVLPEDQYDILERFHKRCLRHITNKHICKGTDGEWSYPNSTELLKECNLKTIREYVSERQAMATRKYLPHSAFFQQNQSSCSFIKLDSAP